MEWLALGTNFNSKIHTFGRPKFRAKRIPFRPNKKKLLQRRMSKLLEMNPDSAAAFLGRIPLSSILQRLPGAIVLVFIPFCFLGPVYAPEAYASYYVFLHIVFLSNVLRTVYGSRIAYLEARNHSTIDWQDKYCLDAKVQSTSDMRHDLPYDCVRHVIIIPQYKEDLGTMFDTLDVLASHSMALTHYKVIRTLSLSP
jgi:hypothetical protein